MIHANRLSTFETKIISRRYQTLFGVERDDIGRTHISVDNVKINRPKTLYNYHANNRVSLDFKLTKSITNLSRLSINIK